MELNQVVQLRLSKNDLNEVDAQDIYSFVFLNKKNYKKYIKDLLLVSSLMETDFDWDGIPDEYDIHERFKNNSFCLLSSYKTNIIGWIWANKNVTPYWTRSVQSLKENEIYVGGSYLSKTVERPRGSGSYFYSVWFDYFLDKMNNQYTYSYVDNWNTRSLELAYKIGMKDYKFL
jgi:hypothetical protein